MKNQVVIVLLIFGTIFLIFKYIFSFKNKISDEFILRMIKVLSQQLIMYFVLVGLLMLAYTFALLDDFKINWQFLIAAFCVFGIFWYFFSFAVILLSNLTVLHWRDVERSSKDLSKIIIYFKKI